MKNDIPVELICLERLGVINMNVGRRWCRPQLAVRWAAVSQPMRSATGDPL